MVWTPEEVLAGGWEEGLGQGRFCSSQLPKALTALTAPHLLQKLSALNSCLQVSGGRALNKHRETHTHTHTHCSTYVGI